MLARIDWGARNISESSLNNKKYNKNKKNVKYNSLYCERSLELIFKKTPFCGE